jgi:hypothetical protein
MATSRAHSTLVMDVQVLVTHHDRVTSMAREKGHPPRLIRGWEAYGITAQVVQIPLMSDISRQEIL